MEILHREDRTETFGTYELSKCIEIGDEAPVLD
jgi:hypothetical protein